MDPARPVAKRIARISAVNSHPPVDHLTARSPWKTI